MAFDAEALVGGGGVDGDILAGDGEVESGIVEFAQVAHGVAFRVVVRPRTRSVTGPWLWWARSPESERERTP